MKREILIMILSLFLYVTGCSRESSGISGTVVDAETGKPIDGAVVLVEWTKTKGIGLTHTESVKVSETVTDASGKFKIPGTFLPFVNMPDVTIYKKGYVAWNNKYIFPYDRPRENSKLEDDILIKLEVFKEEYSFIKHEAFIAGTAHPEQETSKKKLFIKAYEQGEENEVLRERREKDKSDERTK